MHKRWWRGYQDFASKSFCLTVPKSFRRGILYCCNNFGYRKGLDQRGGGEFQDLPSKVFCLKKPKKLEEEPFSVSLISVTEKI